MRVVSGTLFFPRGGSAFVARALALGLREEGFDITLLAGSRDGAGDARAFYGGVDVHAVDFGPALRSPDPVRYADGVPLQPSFEDRPGARDEVFAALDDVAYQRHVDAWSRELEAAGAARADALHLHHLTPLNAAAAVVAPGTPVVGQLHGTELLMLEAIDGAPWPHGVAWAERLRGWAARCERLVVAPGNLRRAAGVLGLDGDRFAPLPNGFDPDMFRRREVDRGAVWRRVLGAAPPDPILLYVGRFTAVKRVPLLLEAFARARPRMSAPATLVVVGGHPGESEGEHPAETIARLGLQDAVRLAGWQEQALLPDLLAASDVLALPSARESFGQVVVEAMACGVPPIAAASPGPARIVEDGETGWLVPVDDRDALADALVDAVDRPDERARRGTAAERVARERYAWPAIAHELAEVLREVARPPRGGAVGARAQSG